MVFKNHYINQTHKFEPMILFSSPRPLNVKWDYSMVLFENNVQSEKLNKYSIITKLKLLFFSRISYTNNIDNLVITCAKLTSCNKRDVNSN